MKAKTKFPKIHTGYARNSVLFAPKCKTSTVEMVTTYHLSTFLVHKVKDNEI